VIPVKPPEPLIFNNYLNSSQNFTGMETDGDGNWIYWDASGRSTASRLYISTDDRVSWSAGDINGSYKRTVVVKFHDGFWYRVMDNFTTSTSMKLQKSSDMLVWTDVSTFTANSCSAIVIDGTTIAIATRNSCYVSHDLGATAFSIIPNLSKTAFSYFSDIKFSGTEWFVVTSQSNDADIASQYGSVFSGSDLYSMSNITSLLTSDPAQAFRGVSAASDGTIVVYSGVCKNQYASGYNSSVPPYGSNVFVRKSGVWTEQVLGLNCGSTTPIITSIETDGFGRWLMSANDGWSAYNFDNFATDWSPNPRYMGAITAWQMGNLLPFPEQGGLWILTGEQEQTPEESRISNDPNNP